MNPDRHSNSINFQISSFLTFEPVLRCLEVVNEALLEVNRLSLLPKLLNSAQPVDEFSKSLCSNVEKQFVNIFDSWHPKLIKNIRACFKNVIKGWFDIDESNWEIFKISKMRKLLIRIRFQMQVIKFFFDYSNSIFILYLLEG